MPGLLPPGKIGGPIPGEAFAHLCHAGSCPRPAPGRHRDPGQSQQAQGPAIGIAARCGGCRRRSCSMRWRDMRRGRTSSSTLKDGPMDGQKIGVWKKTVRHSKMRPSPTKKRCLGCGRNVVSHDHAPVSVKGDDVTIECSIMQGAQTYPISRVHALVLMAGPGNNMARVEQPWIVNPSYCAPTMIRRQYGLAKQILTNPPS